MKGSGLSPRRYLLALVLIATGCSQQPAPPPLDPTKALGPNDCPQGTKLFGDAPPQGDAQWCKKQQPNGKWVEQGPFRSWHQSGAIQASGMQTNGRIDGIFRMYHGNGIVSSEGRVAHGKRVGEFRTWHLNGRLATVNVFADGEENGLHRSWWEDGTLSAEGAYDNGWEHGMWTFWSSNGKLERQGLYLKGKRHDWWSFWTSEGEPKLKKLFQHGQFIAPGELSEPQADVMQESGAGTPP